MFLSLLLLLEGTKDHKDKKFDKGKSHVTNDDAHDGKNYENEQEKKVRRKNRGRKNERKMRNKKRTELSKNHRGREERN